MGWEFEISGWSLQPAFNGRAGLGWQGVAVYPHPGQSYFAL